jgi:hypothetical protein
VVVSKKDKKQELFDTIVKDLKHGILINDFDKIGTYFERFTEELAKSP